MFVCLSHTSAVYEPAGTKHFAFLTLCVSVCVCVSVTTLMDKRIKVKVTRLDISMEWLLKSLVT